MNFIEKELMKSAFKEELLQSQVEIQEQTLEQIGQEIHDNIGQALSFVKLSINTIDLDNREQTETKLFQSVELITKAIQDLRNLSKILNTSFINTVGLSASIQYQLDYLQRTGVYDTCLCFPEMSYKLAPEMEIVLFRVVQELLNNIVKHAQATAVTVKIEYLPGKFALTVIDNGKGFDVTQISDRSKLKGLGLSNMKKRLDPIHAAINIESEPGKGTQVTVSIIGNEVK